jgi:hypothetical protein
MLRRPLRRALALSFGALLVLAGTAAADSVQGDAIIGTPAVDGSRHLGDVAPGGTVSADVQFLVTCIGLQHIDPDQSVVLTGNGGTAQFDGKIESVESVTLTPLKIPWGPDGQGCPDPVPTFGGGVTSHVVLRAPTVLGIHTFTVGWIRSLSPAGGNDANAFSRAPTSVDFTLRVVAVNTPPVLTVPDSFEVEGDTTGGWTSAWTVSATDAEDDPDPIPTCTPAAGPVLSLGTTTVTCTVSDKAGASVSKSFDVIVVDSTAPTLRDLPGDISVTTSDPTGRTVAFATPTATDIVDASPSVTCTPPSGEHFDVGPTTVTCTATDSERNPRSGTFVVTVLYEPPPPPPPPPAHTASAIWLEPVASGDSTLEANRGRTIPVKVQLFVDGHERTTGEATLRLARCGGTTSVDLPLTWSGGRWNVSLDTGGYAAACYTVGAVVDGLAAGSFTLELRGSDPVAKPAGKRESTPTVAPTSQGKGPKKQR